MVEGKPSDIYMQCYTVGKLVINVIFNIKDSKHFLAHGAPFKNGALIYESHFFVCCCSSSKSISSYQLQGVPRNMLHLVFGILKALKMHACANVRRVLKSLTIPKLS